MYRDQDGMGFYIKVVLYFSVLSLFSFKNISLLHGSINTAMPFLLSPHQRKQFLFCVTYISITRKVLLL